MPEPVSTFGVCCAAGLTILSSYARSGTAVSEEAKLAQKAATELVVSAERSQSLFGEKSSAISQLRALANESSLFGSKETETAIIDPVAVYIAESLLRALPAGIPMPEFAAEPDGSISLDWIESKNRLFSLSIGTGNRLAFAWLDGSDKGHAVAHFDGQLISPRIIEGIQSVMNHGNTKLRAA